MPEFTIRECTTLEDYAACIDLQRVVWQFDNLDITPLRSFVSARRNGGFTLGAFDKTGKLSGFAHALAAFDEKLMPYYYSNMLAVEPALQNAGIGIKLKLAQREHALKRGVSLMTWTFDPLQSRNAYLNIGKLAGVVRKYFVNYYGNQSTSALHRGLDTDRLFVEWWVNSVHVIDILSGKSRSERAEAALEVPRNIEVIKKRDIEEARHWQLKLRAGFQACLGEGLYCAGFEADPGGGNGRYLFFKNQIL
ncbi:MAG: GNAT family N-acetyltransferase [Acidobacteria bacterium]|nr:GNAT family N-acetyltransferase [Acidobacteriota bacterium]